MSSGSVVESFDVCEDGVLRRFLGSVSVVVDFFDFEGSEEGFGHRVVIAVAGSAQAWVEPNTG